MYILNWFSIAPPTALTFGAVRQVLDHLRERWNRLIGWAIDHDPIPAAIRWLIGHRRTLGLVAIASFVTMLIFDQTRWNAIATLWGVIGAGLVVSLILEEQGEVIQRRTWLKREANQVAPFLQAIFQRARLVGASCGLPVEVINRIFDLDFRVRTLSFARAREIARSDLTGVDRERLLSLVAKPENANHLQFRLEEIDRLALDNVPILSRLTSLHAKIRRFEEAGRLLLSNLRSPNMPDEVRLILLASTATASIDVCEECSRTLEEAGVAALSYSL